MRYSKLTFHIKAPKPYDFIGSKMRGMLGYALKKEVCINPTMNCEGCFAKKECAFYDMYEKSNVTHQYRMDLKLDEERYKFSLLLFGSLQKDSTRIKKAMLSALRQYKEIETKEKEKKLKINKYTPSVIKLKLITPLRIKRENNFVRDEVSLDDILRSIYRRKRELDGVAYEPFRMKHDTTTVMKNFFYKELTRKSNKQQTKMNIGGLMGEIIISGLDSKVYELLKLGEVIGVGKATVFGLGKIKIEEIA